jgi:hypothetical protein
MCDFSNDQISESSLIPLPNLPSLAKRTTTNILMHSFIDSSNNTTLPSPNEKRQMLQHPLINSTSVSVWGVRMTPIRCTISSDITQCRANKGVFGGDDEGCSTDIGEFRGDEVGIYMRTNGQGTREGKYTQVLYDNIAL